DAHLMIENADRYVKAFAEAGADTLIVHVEANVHLSRVLEQIRQLGKRPAVALNPATPASVLSEVLDDVDQVLVMTVNPGFGGQPFIQSMLPKIERIRHMLGARAVEICVDGGIDETTAPETVRCGADVLVAGTSVFRHERGTGEAIRALRGDKRNAS
ncbi:MAG: ribulose-phosphate 3-epimerase, partial [Chloroflexi bacterium]|nr:ribulose-phosphate 3-epimerase [Chloroflexota bacterium]